MNPVCRIVRTSRLPEGRDAALIEDGDRAVIYVRESLPHKRQRELVRELLRAAKRRLGVLAPLPLARFLARSARRVPWQGAAMSAGTVTAAGAVAVLGLHAAAPAHALPLRAPRRPAAAAVQLPGTIRHPAAGACCAARRDGHRGALPPGVPVAAVPRQGAVSLPSPRLPGVTVPHLKVRLPPLPEVRLPVPHIKVKLPPLPRLKLSVRLPLPGALARHLLAGLSVTATPLPRGAPALPRPGATGRASGVPVPVPGLPGPGL